MIKETTILSGTDESQTYESVDAFFTAHGLEAWRAASLQTFTDAGFDVSDDSKQQCQLSEDKTKVIITVAYDDQEEKDAVLAEQISEDSTGLEWAFSEDHLF
jgi:hypothetical protein